MGDLISIICFPKISKAYAVKAYHSDDPDCEAFLAHFLFDIDECGLRDSLGVDLNGLSI